MLSVSVPDHGVEGPLVGGGVGGGGQGLGGGGGHQGHPARLPHAPGGGDPVVQHPLAVRHLGQEQEKDQEKGNSRSMGRASAGDEVTSMTPHWWQGTGQVLVPLSWSQGQGV